jgi:outer membrane protein TolC/AcrR family transcriptional regulator
MRDRLVERALQLFARHGYDGTSMSDIASALDVTKAALYHHFPSKEQLYLSAMTEMTARLESEIDEQTAAGSAPAEHLRSVVQAHLALFRRHPDLIRALYHNLLTPSVPACAVTVDTETPLHRALDACADAGYLTSEEIPDVFVLLKGGIEYLGVRWLLDPTAPEPSPERGDRLVSRLLPRLVATALAVFLVTSSVAADSDSVHPVNPGPEAVVVIAGDAPMIDLGSCVDEIVAFNAGLEAEREGIEEVRGQLWQARATGLPTIDAVGTWSRSRDPSFALDETFGAPSDGESDLNAFIVRPEDVPPQTFWRASIDATWEINPAQVANAIGGAKLGLARQDAAIAAAEHRLIERGVETYARILRSWESVLAAEAEVRAREEFLDISRRRYRLDVATALDTLQAAVSVANAEPALRRARGELRSYGAELNVLMGRAARSPMRLSPLVPIETDAVDEDLALELADSRPDMRELDYTIEIQRKSRGVRKSEARPRLSLGGSYGFVARDFADLGDEGKDSWRASATVIVPLFDGFLTKGRVREVEAGIRQLQLEREERARQVRSEVLQITNDLEVSRANLAAAVLNVQQSEDALRYTTLRYENDKSDYLSVLNAETERANARQNHIQARYEVLTHTAALKRAIGLSPMASLATAEVAAKQRRANRMKGRSE